MTRATSDCRCSLCRPACCSDSTTGSEPLSAIATITRTESVRNLNSAFHARLSSKLDTAITTLFPPGVIRMMLPQWRRDEFCGAQSGIDGGWLLSLQTPVAADSRNLTRPRDDQVVSGKAQRRTCAPRHHGSCRVHGCLADP